MKITEFKESRRGLWRKWVLMAVVLVIIYVNPGILNAADSRTNSLRFCVVNGVTQNTDFPILVDGSLPMIAVRDLDILGGLMVEWAANTAVLKLSNRSAEVFVNRELFKVEQVIYSAVQPARLIGDRLYIPLDMAAACAGVSYRWDAKTRTVYFDSNQLPQNGKDMQLLKPSMDAEQIFTRVLPSMLYMEVYREDGTLKDRGSGVLISREGYAATAAHVVEGAVKLAAWYNGEKIEDVHIVKIDKKNDIALIRMPPARKYEALELETSGIAFGQTLYAAGYTSKTEPLITQGIVSSPRYTVLNREGIITNAVFVPGMSGGPVVDRYGRVIGIISGSVVSLQSLNLASPASEIVNMFNELIEK